MKNLQKNTSFSILSIYNIVYDIVSNIKDPEFNNKTLEDLEVISERNITVSLKNDYFLVKIIWKPTVFHCKFAVNISLAIRYAIKRETSLPKNLKIDVFLEKNSHFEEEMVNKQSNDKERYSNALENERIIEYLKRLVD